jgi:hypothetical protein
MNQHCPQHYIVVAILTFTVGVALLVLSLLALLRPNSWIVQYIFVLVYPKEQDASYADKFFGKTRERVGNGMLKLFRFIGPVLGAGFIYLSVQALKC